MDQFLSLIGMQAMKYAVRSGIVLASNYALNQCSGLITKIDDRKLEEQLRSLQELLDCKIRVISPAIDLIELKSGRGNVFLESAVPITQSLQQQIITLGRYIEGISAPLISSKSNTDHKDSSIPPKVQLLKAFADIKSLLDRIDRDIPLLQLAITASGESFSTSLPPTISPSRLLQASTFIVMGDSQFTHSDAPVQIGPTFSLSLYMLFLGHGAVSAGESNSTDSHANIYGLGENDRKPLWQEVMHKATVRIYRSNRDEPGKQSCLKGSNCTPGANLSKGYHYYLELIEDLNDGRLHFEADTDAPSGTSESNRRESIPIHQVSKIFYTDTGKLLNIREPTEDENRPILLLKREAFGSTRTITPAETYVPSARYIKDDGEEKGDQSESHDFIDDQNLIDIQIQHEAQNISIEKSSTDSTAFSSLPKHLDPEWLAFEMYMDHDDQDDESEGEEDQTTTSSPSTKPTPYHLDSITSDNSVEYPEKTSGLSQAESNLSVMMKDCSLADPSDINQLTGVSTNYGSNQPVEANPTPSSPFSGVTTSLSLLEMMIRLVGLQESQQTSHLSIPDHILTFFLEETSTTGYNGSAREASRKQTEKRVGFNPCTDD